MAETNAAAISDSRATSDFMRARVRTANTGGPVSISLAWAAAGRSAAEARCRAEAKAVSIRWSGLFLRIDIEACCNGLDHQERTALVG